MNYDTVLDIAFGPYFDRRYLSFIINFVCSDNRIWTYVNSRTYVHAPYKLGSRINKRTRINLGQVTLRIETNRCV